MKENPPLMSKYADKIGGGDNKVRVFVSWSGERSRRVGELLDQWLQCVIQAIDPWMSTKDIDRGALWFSEINNQLKETSVGVIVLTKENKEKPWILFEAGALAKGLTSSRVCIVLVDIEPSDVRDPLAQFNLTMPDNNGIWRLVCTLNASLQERALKEQILRQVFETYWPQFEMKLAEILEDTPDTLVMEKSRTNDDIFAELIDNTRNISRRMRELENQHSIEKISMKSNSRNSNFQDYRKLIRIMIANNVDDEVIAEALRGMAPKSWVRSTIEDARTVKLPFFGEDLQLKLKVNEDI
ncbi:toll/interleukin-1 receptor domain-containing protein [Paenibacillus jamilae]